MPRPHTAESATRTPKGAVSVSAMVSTRRTLWVLLTLPMLAGAVLLLHGLDAQAAEAHTAPSSEAASARDGHHHDAPDHCASCSIGHLAAACVAIVVTTSALIITSRRKVGARAAFTTPALLRVVRRSSTRSPRPPAWVELAVMTC